MTSYLPGMHYCVLDLPLSSSSLSPNNQPWRVCAIFFFGVQNVIGEYTLNLELTTGHEEQLNIQIFR